MGRLHCWHREAAEDPVFLGGALRVERARTLLVLSHLFGGFTLCVQRMSSWMLLASLTGAMDEKVLSIIL